MYQCRHFEGDGAYDVGVNGLAHSYENWFHAFETNKVRQVRIVLVTEAPILPVHFTALSQQ